MPKPGKFQAIAIMQLISGCLGALWLAGAILSTLGLALLAVVPIYGIVVAVFEIVSGARGLGQNPRQYQSFYRTVAIMEIVNIITCNVPALVVGVLVLSFLKDPEVEAFFAGTWQPRPVQYVVQQPAPVYQIVQPPAASPVQTVVPPPPAQPIVVPPPSPPAENGTEGNKS